MGRGDTNWQLQMELRRWKSFQILPASGTRQAQAFCRAFDMALRVVQVIVKEERPECPADGAEPLLDQQVGGQRLVKVLLVEEKRQSYADFRLLLGCKKPSGLEYMPFSTLLQIMHCLN